MKIPKKWQGLNSRRYRQNPKERLIAEIWQKYNVLEFLLNNASDIQQVEVSDRDQLVANTVIQWLGSPVGQAFIHDFQYACKNWKDEEKAEEV